jgi:hypothetical protein
VRFSRCSNNWVTNAVVVIMFRFTKFWEKNIVIIREKWSVGIMINKEWLEPRLA